jgi:hypothetical protein
MEHASLIRRGERSRPGSSGLALIYRAANTRQPGASGQSTRHVDSSNNLIIVIANPQCECGNPGFTRPYER